jgi:hypothetical protein
MVDYVLERMKRDGLPIDRENYIWAAYGATPPEWGPELEAELPVELQVADSESTCPICGASTEQTKIERCRGACRT